jgi:succinyl-CoA synthetase alpha subunit
MSIKHRIYPNLYKDSVSLMTVSAEALRTEGVVQASVVMASATNLENLADSGLGSYSAKANDLIVAVDGTDEGCDAALAAVDALLTVGGDSGHSDETSAGEPPASIQMAVQQDPAINLALISVPGDYAAAEAYKALRLGMDVMIFSDNMPAEQELLVKEYAESVDLLVMGPDCGTAIVNGVPLGFANVVRKGTIGVVGASGTGTQEVTVRVHQLGCGISQAVGTGGHDLADQIGGISMLHGLAALGQDPGTEVIVLVSKPPAARVAEKVLDAAAATGKPVVVSFLGADPVDVERNGIYAAASLAEAADMAVALVSGVEPRRQPVSISHRTQTALREAVSKMAPSQRFLRGIYSGGTFCFEAQLLAQSAGVAAHSNTPTVGNQSLARITTSVQNTIIDMGDDEFTQGRPHPMIDPSLRDARVRQEIRDPETAVVLFDVVLGYGSSDDPVGELIGVVDSARAEARADGRAVLLIAHVCGTDADHQDRDRVVAALTSAGVLVAGSNAEAATWAAHVARDRQGGNQS